MFNRKIHLDCRHYRGDRPCAPHKRSGVICDNCPDYQPESTRVLILKLGAAGDVLRTTCILPVLREQYCDPAVYWVTLPENLPLLKLPRAGASARLGGQLHEHFKSSSCAAGGRRADE
ncbi:MAG: hypothetical protein ABH878_06850 [bacterium]